MKFEKDYKIEKWTKWNSFLNDSIGDFYNSFSIYPNILEANGHTHSQIDFLTNVIPEEKERLRMKDKLTDKFIKPQQDDEVKISSFVTGTVELDFAVDEKLDDRVLRLVYDSEPDWGDEPSCDFPVGKDELVTVHH